MRYPYEVVLLLSAFSAAHAQDAGVGTWPSTNGTVNMACPAVGEYARVTALPTGCQALQPCACYTLAEHAATTGEVAGLRVSVRELSRLLEEHGEAAVRRETALREAQVALTEAEQAIVVGAPRERGISTFLFGAGVGGVVSGLAVLLVMQL